MSFVSYGHSSFCSLAIGNLCWICNAASGSLFAAHPVTVNYFSQQFNWTTNLQRHLMKYAGGPDVTVGTYAQQQQQPVSPNGLINANAQ